MTVHEASFTVAVTPPFRLDATVWVLRRRPKNMIDRWDGETYSRILVLHDKTAELAVSLGGTANAPHLVARLRSGASLTPARQATAKALLQKMLGLAVDAAPFYTMTARHPELDQLARQFIGVRPTRFPTAFEALTNAIACQQVSLGAGIALLNRLSEAFGPVFSGNGLAAAHAFPRPEDVLDVSEEALRQLGFSYQKARTIKEVAYQIVSNDIDADRLEIAGNEEIATALQAVRGIGRWSAEYVLLRGFGRLDVFPGDDVGGQNNVRALLGLDKRPGYAELKDLTAAWQPYAGFVYFHLLLNKLHEKELV